MRDNNITKEVSLLIHGGATVITLRSCTIQECRSGVTWTRLGKHTSRPMALGCTAVPAARKRAS